MMRSCTQTRRRRPRWPATAAAEAAAAAAAASGQVLTGAEKLALKTGAEKLKTGAEKRSGPEQPQRRLENSSGGGNGGSGGSGRPAQCRGRGGKQNHDI
jgi:hypothetical protein